MTLATVDSRHFAFQVLGRSRTHATQLLRAAYAQHCLEYTDADPTFIRTLLDDTHFVEVEVGSMFRDWQPMQAVPTVARLRDVMSRAHSVIFESEGRDEHGELLMELADLTEELLTEGVKA